MVIYLNNEGRFGHHISLLVTLLIYSIQYKRPIYYDSFENKYAHYFKKSEHNVKISIWLVFFSRLIYKLLKLLRINKFSIYNFYFLLYTDKNNEILFNDDIKNIFTHKKPYIITDYMLNDVISVNNYAHLIRKSIKIKSLYEKEIISSLNEIKNKNSTIIAIHIRKTDFKNFANGKYYFSEAEYKKVLDRFISVLNLNINETAIIICSDENIDTSIFKPYNIYYHRRSTIDDFCILKNADYIISTRSIFSSCASLLGQNKIYQIINLQKDFTKDDIVEFTDLMLTEYNLKIRKDNII